MFLSDIHYPYQDDSALQIAYDFCQDFKPHYRVCLGDLLTLDQISNYPNDCEVDIYDEWEMANQFLDRFKITHFLMGNHEWRGYNPLNVPRNQRKDRDPAIRLHLNERGIKYKAWDSENPETMSFGKIYALHGKFTLEHTAKAHAQAYGCCVFGHSHRMQTFQPKHAREKNTGFNIGCLCKLNLHYTKKWPAPGWTQGFAYAHLFKGGQFSLDTARLVGNEFVINGKYYKR